MVKEQWEKIFQIVREVILFLTGIGIIFYSVASQGHDIPFLVTGLVLVGIVPIDSLLGRMPHKGID